MIQEIRSRFAMLTARERARWVTLLPIGVATSVLETLAAAAVYGLVGILSGSGAALGGRAFGWLRAGDSAVSVAVVAAGLLLMKNAMMLAAAAYRARIGGATAAALSSRALKAYLNAPF